MLLPGAENTIVDPRKIRDYLLSPTHPVGRYKAAFFADLGYSQEDWGVLARKIRELATREGSLEIRWTEYGSKFAMLRTLQGPRGSAPIVTVWIILDGEESPRFVTAYPGGQL